MTPGARQADHAPNLSFQGFIGGELAIDTSPCSSYYHTYRPNAPEANNFTPGDGLALTSASPNKVPTIQNSRLVFRAFCI